MVPESLDETELICMPKEMMSTFSFERFLRLDYLFSKIISVLPAGAKAKFALGDARDVRQYVVKKQPSPAPEIAKQRPRCRLRPLVLNYLVMEGSRVLSWILNDD